MLQKLAPICLFVYNRPHHVQLTIQALAQNKLAKESDLIIYADGSKSVEQADKVSEVRNFISRINGFHSVTVIEREKNYGLANSIIEGVTNTLNKYGRIIVLEDDMVTSPYFLTYMNEALEKYRDNDKVVCIHGYVCPTAERLPETFFLRGADCWGWATWSRGWACFNPDGKFLYNELKKRKLFHAFDYNGAYPFTKMLVNQIKGKNDSWAIRWYASAYLLEKLTLYPSRSLVQNIGNDNSGTHCEKTTDWLIEVSKVPVKLDDIPVVLSELGRDAFECHFREIKPDITKRILKRIFKLFKTIKLLCL
jgi:glycosyltransferase involved in cell wall biosynthesis